MESALKFTRDDFLPQELLIKGVKIQDKRPDGNGLHSYNGLMHVQLEEHPEAGFNVEWAAYHKNSDKQFLKTDVNWLTLYGDWHIYFVCKDANIELSGFELVEDDGNRLSKKEEDFFVLSVFQENYLWKAEVEQALNVAAAN